ncbi:uncharacterized protein LOC103868325 isoform X2 [Brassica rapa]|uniref:uncharacterized protein LOC103868325 isoform X2 n=1 Tax=Brassica campestris TaxID=3711 RepID=UPI0004F16F99|nr:uncharacterized protein LOC103868325 isoform X2 [Brassica rapa]
MSSSAKTECGVSLIGDLSRTHLLVYLSSKETNPNSVMEDWEVVIESSGTNPKSLEEIEDGTQGMVTFDYFSIQNSNSNSNCVGRVDAIDEDGSVQSGSPGWIEPTSDAPYGPKLFSELWSDSSSDRLDDVNNDELGLEKSEEYSKSIAKEKHLDKHTEREEESPVSVQGKSVSGGGGEERVFVWWKIPIDVLKYCVFRVNPLWSFSMAAAVVGFVMLGRRLYHMKKSKSSTLQLKVLLDDKVASHAARLNEAAISLVKRVPIIRPALPSSVVGMNQWSMMSLR